MVDEERLTDSNSLKKDIAKVIASMDIDIQQYIGHFFPEDTQAARVIQLSLNYLYSLGTEGGARKECYLSYEQRKLWKSRYGALDTQEAAGSKTVNIIGLAISSYKRKRTSTLDISAYRRTSRGMGSRTYIFCFVP